LATRAAAAALFVFNIVAVVSFWHVLGQNQAALNSHWYWGVLLAVTMLHGPGKLSLDHLIWKRVTGAPILKGAS
jgi:putative oxidoreductase